LSTGPEKETVRHGFFRKALFLSVLFFLPEVIFPQTQKVLPLSSPLYDEMDALYALCGLAAPSAARPWTNAKPGRCCAR
jgi:hypothetical protein